jgi:hypothetical protein
MKKAGIGGAILFDAGSSSYNGMTATEPGPVFMSDEWRDLFVTACSVADSLGLELSLNIGSGWNDGGPWVTPEETSKKLVWSECTVQGPGEVAQKLPMPEGLLRDERDGSLYYRPIAVLALRLTPESRSVRPLENLHLKAIHSIHIPRRTDGLGFDWDVFLKDEPSAENDCHVLAGDVIDLSDRLLEDGTLRWLAPEGEFLVLRFGYTGTGIRVSTHSPGGGGLAIDYMSREAMDLQYEQTVGKLRDDLVASGSKSLKYLHDDSWELGAANWTHHFERLFEKATGYALLPFLPVLTGRIVESRDVSNRFLYDFRRTVADLIRENHYKRFRDRAHADGFGIHPESGGPHPAPIDALKNLGLSDIPMGEFWIRANTHRIAPESRLFIKQAASAAHIYGKRFVQAEGPTSIGPHWEEDFAYMKPTLDRVYCEGLNRLVIHTFTHSPAEAGVPGNEYFAGTHFNPNVTWWHQAPAFLLWNSRLSFLLSQGLFVGDVCFYYGDNVPNQVPLKHVPEGLGAGYDYDVCNTETILERMTVREGKICLPDGMSYHLLALPERRSMRPEVIARLEELVRQGATLTGVRPLTSVGLRGGSEAAERVRRIAGAMWGDEEVEAGDDRSTFRKVSCGKGAVYTGGTLRDILRDRGVGPDFTFASARPEALVDFLHRRLEDGTDIYYVVNRRERAEFFHATFRVEGKRPELWNAVTGEICDCRIYLPDEGTVRMPMFLEPFGSVAVIFRKDAGVRYERIALNGTELFPDLPTDTFVVSPFVHRPDGSVLFTQPGEYRLTSSGGAVSNVTAEKAVVTDLRAPWSVRFDPRWGGPPEERLFTELRLWNSHEDASIRYYSGTAVYAHSFDWRSDASEGRRVYLDLGAVYNLAEVYVNGQSAGVWWQPPFTGDVTDLLLEGRNRIELKVVNLWPNRLTGDSRLPDSLRFTKTNVTKFTGDYPLLPSGLGGPVRLVSYAESCSLERDCPVER